MRVGALNFEADVRSEILKYLPHDKQSNETTRALADMPTHRLIVTFLNWRERLIHAHPRRIHLSRELILNAAYLDRKEQVDGLLLKISTGAPVAPHLSELVVQGFVLSDPKKPSKRNPSLDLLLNDWGMHHLHISNAIRQNGFVERADHLVIAIFRADACFVIDVVDHNAWTDETLVKIAYRNWPDEHFFLPLNCVQGLSEEISSEDRNKLRAAGVASMIQFDGKVLMPATGGLSTARTSARVSIATGHLVKLLRFYEANPQRLADEFINNTGHAQVSWPEVPDFRFRLIVTPEAFRCAIFEMETGRGLSLPEL